MQFFKFSDGSTNRQVGFYCANCGWLRGLLATKAITRRLWVQNLFCISQEPVGEYTVFCNNQVVAGWLPTSLYTCKTDLTDQSDCISRLTMLYGKISSNLRKQINLKKKKTKNSCWVHSVVRIELLLRDWLISYCIMSRRTGVPNKNCFWLLQESPSAGHRKNAGLIQLTVQTQKLRPSFICSLCT